MALQPLIWLKNATKNASKIGLRFARDQNPPPSGEAESFPLAKSEPSFFIASHRGLSSRNGASARKRNAGAHSAPSIQRQAFSPTSLSARLDASATTMPVTMLNWKSAVSRPRLSAGEISAMYTGAAIVEMPTPNPPIRRATISATGPPARALQSAETK